ncbi:uncharacterized protein LOC134273605 [Saccostrea cucullata]|uniref:uncharacterized protein LOC134273605 n=1 Tax=Saccostrea cuccullata TaxID=36930 RepID=UPI002ED5BFAB
MESILSQKAYLYLQFEIGTPAEVNIRRQIRDIEEIILNSATSTVKLLFNRYPTYFRVATGSEREGFNFKESDSDFLYWWTDHKVICHPRQENLYNKETLIMMEYCDDSPGSVFLKVGKWSRWRFVRDSYVRFGKGTYMSSLKYRESTRHLVVRDSQLHGPCASGQLSSGVCYDNAHSLKCDFFPEIASSWIKHCETKGWPDSTVLQYARRTGCNFVPIGRKNSPNHDYEWRISFNLIELNCVRSMNHVQFTCYGLFKIFLNKVIKPLLDDKELLCSYFLKTIMFYMIQEKEGSFWSPENLLHCFWNCFKRLIFCVYKSNLPNFFIQENNMFQGKIFGSSREELLEKLYLLYNMGYSCLRQCIFQQKFITYPYVERNHKVECTLFTEIYHRVGFCTESAIPPYLEVYMITIKKLLERKSMTHVQLMAVRQNICTIFIHLAFLLLDYEKTSNICKSGDLLEVAVKHGFLSDNVFYGMYLCRKSRFMEALSFAKKIKNELNQSHVLYLHGFGDMREFMTYGKDKSWNTKLREVVVVDIGLSSAVCYLHELGIEKHVARVENKHFHVPPYVLTLFIIVLCNVRLGNRTGYYYTVCELKNILDKDVGRFVPIKLKNISWQILGICQQLSGDHAGAFESYKASLIYQGSCMLTRATYIRMLTVISDLQMKHTHFSSTKDQRPKNTIKKEKN